MAEGNRKSIVIVGNAGENMETLKQTFGEEYQIFKDENVFESARNIVQNKERLAAVFIDVAAPEKDAYTILDGMRKVGILKQVPFFIMIAKEVPSDIELGCYRKGASAVIRKPYGPLVIKERVKHWIELYESNAQLQSRVTEQSEAMRQQFRGMQKQEGTLRLTDEKLIDKISMIIEFRNLESRFHLDRIRGFTRILAQSVMENYPEYKLDQAKVDVIAQASVVHDVGKITISDTILLKPGRLTEDEFDLMKSHTTRGCDIIRMMVDIQDKEYYDMCMDIVRHHHERYDGRGYPDGLRGEEISIAAQIVSVADVYDALVTDRIYKAAFTPERAFEMIMNGECGLFSIKLLNCFEISRPAMERMLEKTMEEERAERES